MQYMFYDPVNEKYTHIKNNGYINVFRGESDIYIEAWNTDDKRRFELAYTQEEYDNEAYHLSLIEWKQQKFGVKIKNLAHLVLPPNKFDEYARRDGVSVREIDIHVTRLSNAE